MTITQKVSTVNNSDSDINTEITAQNADGFIVASITLTSDDTNAVILFQKVNTDA